MKTTVKNLTPTKVQLTVSLGKKELDDAEHVALHKLAKKVKVSGFRTGKVPESVAAKHVDSQQLQMETVDNAVSKAVAEAFLSESLRALARPEVEVTKFVPGEMLEFTAETEVMPKVKLAKYDSLKVPKREKVTVKKADIDEVLTRIRTQLATKVTVDRAAKMGDDVVIDFVGKKDGVAFDGGTGNDHTLALGSGSFIPGFEEAVVGHKPGEDFEIKVPFPKNYHVDDLAGQSVVFETKLKEVKEVQLPELTDELAAKVGPYTSAKDLTDDIKRELQAQRDRAAAEQLRDDLVKQLVEKSTVPVPDVILKSQLESLERDVTQNLMYQGVTLDVYLKDKGFKTREEWIEKELTAKAEERSKASIALAELSDKEKISVTADELAARISQFKEQYAKDQSMAARFDDAEVRRDIESQLVIDKTIDKLVSLNS